MPATRLLVIADPKLLPTLAAGLREADRFEVIAVPIADLAGASAAIQGADALALFYGTPDRPLAATLQTLAAPLRERGGRVIGVLQRDQVAQRDDCFRAGASELLYMPMPKDQFVSRLQSAVQLSYAGEQGCAAAVSFATRTSTVELPAQVTPHGVHGDGELAFRAGETVRISWPGFQSWGLVARGGPGPQVRFAGLWPEDEKQLREWLRVASGGAARLDQPPLARPATAISKPPPAMAASAAASATPAPSAELPAAPRAAPAAGPPPGFADRRPIRPASATRTPSRMPTPVPAPGATSTPLSVQPVPAPGAASTPPGVPRIAAAPALAPAPAATPRALTPPSSAAVPAAARAGAVPAGSSEPDPAGPAPSDDAPGSSVAPAPDGVAAAAPAAASALPAPAAAAPEALAGIFEDGPAPAPADPNAAVGPMWPRPPVLATCKTAAVKLLADRESPLPPDLGADLTGAVRKVVGSLASTERAALERLGFDSALADALAARIALEAARTEGSRLYTSAPPAVVDQAALAGLTQIADAAASRLQKEADAAITKGEVEQLQLVTGGSAALSRDLLSFKETADRLLGKSAAPRLGAGALDPHLMRPGQAPRLQPRPGAPDAAPVRAELRDFASLDETRPRKGLQRALIVATLLLALAVGNFLFFSGPHVRELPVEQAGQGVKKILVSDGTALVTVDKQFIDHFWSEYPHLLEVLRSRGAKKAALELEPGGPAGFIDVATGKSSGVPIAPEPKSAPDPKAAPEPKKPTTTPAPAPAAH